VSPDGKVTDAAIAPPAAEQPLDRDRIPDRRPLVGSLVATFFSQAAVVVTGILTARSLGPTDRGYWALLVLVPAILQQLGTLGLPLATTYFIASDRSKESAVLRAIRNPAIAQVLALTIIQGAVLWFLVAGDPNRVRLAAAASLLLIAGSVADMYGKAILQGQGRFTALNIVRPTTVTFALVGIVILFARGDARLAPVAAVWVAATLVGGAVTLAVALARRQRRDRQEPPVARGPMVRFGLRGLLGSASPIETFRVDQAAIGLVLPAQELGLYVAALSFTNLPALISRSVGMIALPQVARTSARGSSDVWRFFWISVVLTGIVVAVLELWAGFLVPLFFGEDFEEAVPMTRILLVGAFLYAARRVLTDGVSGSGMPGLGSIAELSSWFVLIPLMAILVGPWGAEGVATALTISAAFSLALLVVLFRRAERRTPTPKAPVPVARPYEEPL
jgi:O-antigen/teichoic acid export membrane protein